MNRIRWTRAAWVVFALAGVVQSEAAGGDGPWAYGGWGHWAYYFPNYPLYGREYIPYYALHPPVYYSFPIPRTYGRSPFAYPPCGCGPEPVLQVAQPKVIANPFVEHGEPQPASPPRSAEVQPKRVANPYVNVSHPVDLAGAQP
jgi:hypothetical protein